MLQAKALVEKILDGKTTKEELQKSLSTLQYLTATEQEKILAAIFKEDKKDVKPPPPVVDDRKVPFERLMQVLATVPKPLSDRFSATVIQKFWDDLQRPPQHMPAYRFRTADGFGTCLLYPQLGKAGTSYAQSVTPSRYRKHSELPDARTLFHELMKRPTDQFVPHPNSVSALILGLAGIVTHDLFSTDPLDPRINRTSHYGDLAPLYGVNQEEQNRVRVFTDGLIKPDTFADIRLQFQMPALVCILVLLSRNHNYIAKKLLEVADKEEDYRFTRINGADSPLLPAEKTDELVFQTARLINCNCYVNMILHESLPVILGLESGSAFTLDLTATPPQQDPSTGNVVSVEFAYVYRWHGAISREDVEWLRRFPAAKKYLQLKNAAMQAELKAKEEKEAQKNGCGEKSVEKNKASYVHGVLADMLQDFGYSKDELTLGPVFLGIHRNPETGAFNDRDVIEQFKRCMTSVCSRMGPRLIPEELEEVEVQGIKAARRIGLGSLNDLRRFLNTKPYESYEEMLTSPYRKADPEVVRLLEKHYGKDGIEKVEMYPGVVLEAAPDVGLGLPYTASHGILSDATNLLRNDRFYVQGKNPYDLTFWGYEYCTKPRDETRHSVFTKLLLNNFPSWFEVICDRGFADHLLQTPFKVTPFKTDK